MADNTYFQGNPVSLSISRSRMSSAPRWTGTWRAGRLVPLFATSSVLPGSTYRMDISSAIRMAKMDFPTMDDVDITIEAFFVPHRLVMSRRSMTPDVNDSQYSWESFIGAQDYNLNMPVPAAGRLLPNVQIEQDITYYKIGGVADCLGMPRPAGTGNKYKVNALKFLAYYEIWNEYFREPNCQSPVTYEISSGGVKFWGSDAGVDGTNSHWSSASRFDLAPVSRYHGYFGSALPWPQRNSTQVTLPLGDFAPVVTGDRTKHPYYAGASASNLAWADKSDPDTLVTSGALGVGSTYTVAGGTAATGTSVVPANLFADLSTATAATVNQFRLAVQTQRFYEALARSGNKYYDLINGIWGVRNSNNLDRPEYLGGFTAPINVSQVAATNGGASGDLGGLGAYSLSNPSGFLFSKSFSEHGTLMVVACCRVRDSYCSGIAREDTKFEPLEFYVPQFASLGEQTILNKELCVTGTVGGLDDSVFGYQEAWAEYRYDPDKVTGYASPAVSTGLTNLTYANYWTQAPTLKGYLDATGEEALLDRSLTTSGSTAGFQFYGQFQFHITKVLPMPLYSIPGLVDHH